MPDSWLIIWLILLVNLCSSVIIQKGYLHAGTEYSLNFTNTNPADCLEYTFMTNYKKVYFDLITTPSKNASYKQRIILTDTPHTTCPQKWSEEPNYCTAISNRIYSETQATFSKWFPTLYVYIINQPPIATALSEFIDEAQRIENSDEDNIEHTTPIFKLKPAHLKSGCTVLENILPRCAALSNSDCINAAFCTTDWGLLTCQSATNDALFSLCTSADDTPQMLTEICSAHASFSANYNWEKWNNPVPYAPSLSESQVSIFLLSCLLMTSFIFCVCCYNIRLLKNGEAPCDICPICPECLFPREIEDDPLYNDNSEEDGF
jgi:hypothetical protein